MQNSALPTEEASGSGTSAPAPSSAPTDTIHQRLYVWCLQHHGSVVKAAQKARMSQDTLYQIVRGKTPTVDAAEKIQKLTRAEFRVADWNIPAPGQDRRGGFGPWQSLRTLTMLDGDGKALVVLSCGHSREIEPSPEFPTRYRCPECRKERL